MGYLSFQIDDLSRELSFQIKDLTFQIQDLAFQIQDLTLLNPLSTFGYG